MTNYTITCAACSRMYPLAIHRALDPRAYDHHELMSLAFAGMGWAVIQQAIHCRSCTDKRLHTATMRDAVAVANGCREMQQAARILVQA